MSVNHEPPPSHIPDGERGRLRWLTRLTTWESARFWGSCAVGGFAGYMFGPSESSQAIGISIVLGAAGGSVIQRVLTGGVQRVRAMSS